MDIFFTVSASVRHTLLERIFALIRFSVSPINNYVGSSDIA